jgi:hypothetical protein
MRKVQHLYGGHAPILGGIHTNLNNFKPYFRGA